MDMNYVLLIVALVSLGPIVLSYYLYRSYSNLIGMVEDFLYGRNKEFKATLYSTGSFPRDVINMTAEDIQNIKDAMGVYEKEEGK